MSDEQDFTDTTFVKGAVLAQIEELASDEKLAVLIDTLHDTAFANPHPTRRALINAPAERVAAYLPANYEVVLDFDFADVCVIAGHDHYGWTLDEYVLPRLASGLIVGTEFSD